MKAGNVDNPNFDQLQKLDKELKSKIRSREKEIESINQLYNKKIESEKKIGEENYQNQIDMNEVKLKTANHDFENKLKKLGSELPSISRLYTGRISDEIEQKLIIKTLFDFFWEVSLR